jgi:LCP family protein required for cell wall assembly
MLLGLVVAPHLLAHGWGTAANSTFQRVFSGNLALAEGSGAQPAGARDPGFSERINMLVIGIDKTPDRTATLTDTMMVLSVDPVGETVSMLSLPRDLVDVPLGNGDRYTAKLNSLYSYADRHPEEFPDGGLRALEDAIGALLGIPIHYYALMDFVGFVKMIDAVGGVDIDVTHGFYDPEYDGYGMQGFGWGVEPGLH